GMFAVADQESLPGVLVPRLDPVEDIIVPLGGPAPEDAVPVCPVPELLRLGLVALIRVPVGIAQRFDPDAHPERLSPRGLCRVPTRTISGANEPGAEDGKQHGQTDRCPGCRGHWLSFRWHRRAHVKHRRESGCGCAMLSRPALPGTGAQRSKAAKACHP